MELGLADKVVIVTGAASGIGAAIARALVAEGAALLLLTDRDDAGCRRPGAPTPRRASLRPARRALAGWTVWSTPPV